jgi:transcriptional regulator GlxA family with amidase domain
MCKNSAMSSAPQAVTTRPHRVAVLGLDPVVGYDLAIPPQIFRVAESPSGEPLYDVRVCSLGARPLPTASGYSISPDHGAEVLADADTVIIPGTRIAGPRHQGTLPDEVREALSVIRPGTRIMSICTGAFVLGAAGVLDRRRATTHWAYAEQFRTLYPDVDLDEGVLFVDEGDVLTSAGLGAGVDLCLHVVRRDHGAEVANQVARYCVVPPWREGGQAQFIDRHVPELSTASTAEVREWAHHHLAEPIDVPHLAKRARMSVRTFTRRFREETGMSPGAWLIQQRVRQALHLLETTDLTVDRVAAEAGLGTGASLRQHLRAALGVSPLAYRRTFRGTRAG